MLKIFFLLFFLFIASCEKIAEDPKIILGHEWNASAGTVADTTSQFKANDIIVIQMDNGKPFPATEIELRIYQGETDRILFKRAIPVKSVDGKATVKGTDSQPLTARNILRTTAPGTYRVAFAIGDSVMLEKKLELVK